MRRSEIFESFIKIAQEKGMISEDAPEKAQKILEKTRRADSLSVEDIAKLYGVKPDAPEGMKYKRNIIENAHPTSFVISDSYDKINGLVENENERQNISIHITQKHNNGLLTQHKYAQQELLMSLVRIGNDLDSQNKEELRALSDTCLDQLVAKKPIKKTAFVWFAAIGAALLGAIYAKNHMRFISDGFQQDHQKLMSELEDLSSSNSDWDVGTDYKPEFLNMINDLKTRLTAFYNLEQQVEPIMAQLQTPRDAKQLIELAKHPDSHNVLTAYKTFRNAAANILPYLQTVEKDFANEMYKQNQTSNKGFLTDLVDKTQILHGGKGLVADDFDDVRHALDTYLMDIANIIKVLKGADSIEQHAHEELQQASAADAQMFGGAPSETAANPAAPAAGEASPEGGIADQVSELEKHLSGVPGL